MSGSGVRIVVDLKLQRPAAQGLRVGPGSRGCLFSRVVCDHRRRCSNPSGAQRAPYQGLPRHALRCFFSGPRGGMADASVLGADVREGVGVRVSPRPLDWDVVRPTHRDRILFDTAFARDRIDLAIPPRVVPVETPWPGWCRSVGPPLPDEPPVPQFVIFRPRDGLILAHRCTPCAWHVVGPASSGCFTELCGGPGSVSWVGSRHVRDGPDRASIGECVLARRGESMLGLRELAMVATVVLVLYGRSGVLQSRRFQSIWPWIAPVRRTTGRPGGCAGPPQTRGKRHNPTNHRRAACRAGPICFGSRGTACSGS